MVIEAVTVIRGENNNGVVEHAASLEGGDYLANLIIDHGAVGVVVCTLMTQLLICRVFQMNDRIVIVVQMVASQLAQWCGLTVEIVVANGGR